MNNLNPDRFSAESAGCSGYKDKNFLIFVWNTNGLSNYITIKIVKAVEKDMDDVQAIDDKAVFFYQTLNIGFGLFILAIIAFFFVNSVLWKTLLWKILHY